MADRFRQLLSGPQIRTEFDDGFGVSYLVTPLRFFPVYHSRDRQADYVSDKSQTGVGYRK